ncbi:type I polyketide synthase, partial [Saccharomonospora saliphila]|uniref:type I polyketide synthase n=1 Tax=Saccharomonospora saliphila TaxID=369829 RepID=UPI0006627702
MACSFPGAESVEEFWSLLSSGGDAVTEVPGSRWEVRDWYREGEPVPGHSTTKWGGFVRDVAAFDARFFGIPAEEAALMDPQQRLLLTTTHRALEDAGLPPERLAGTRCGVFVGVTNNDYRALLVRDQVESGAYTGTGTAPSIASGRLSYLFDLAGPSLTVDTACSSSLVAVHHARESLRRGECDTAIVAGVNLMLDPDTTVALSQAGMMSPSGRCHAFDHRADGYVRGEGCGVVVLRRESDALARHDRVRAVVAGSAVNQDGHSSTLTAPNGLAQQAVLREALDAAGLAPEQVGHVEAHGTGTSLGDPIEMSGIAEVYGRGDTARPLWVGSVKTNIGHLESAAGIAGLIKSVLALEHRTIPASLHVEQLNPLISLDGTRCRVATRNQPWPAGQDGRAHAAAVSSFGFSGTNAHVVLTPPGSEAPSPAPDDGVTWRVLPLSAAHADALATTVDDA